MRVTADKVTEPRLFITSDLHLGHKNIIQYCNRPFDFTDQGIEECDDFPDRAPNLGLVERFNFGLLPRFNLSLVARFNFGLPT